MKGMRIFFLSLLILFFLASIFHAVLHRIKPEVQVPPHIRKELAELALKSLEHSDVPVGSIVTYQDKIIGKGYNTVFRDSILCGHAEINALTEVLKKTGYQKFMVLDRSQLVLYSTFEPCEMCMGTLQHYNVRKVVYMKEKSLLDWWKEDLKSFYFQLQKRKAEGGNIQDSIFHLHPDYPGKK